MEQSTVSRKWYRIILLLLVSCLRVTKVHAETPEDSNYIFIYVAGEHGRDQDGGDGPWSRARFGQITDVVIDAERNAYVTDYNIGTIRKITPERVVSTFAGAIILNELPTTNFLDRDGIGRLARFKNPFSLAIDSFSNLYVAEPGLNTIRKISPTGNVTTLAGFPTHEGSYLDGVGLEARFHLPTGLCVDAQGNVFVTDCANHIIRKITPEGIVTTLAGKAGETNHINGTIENARFSSPFDLTIDQDGHIYVADRGNYAIRKISTNGIVNTIGEKYLAFTNENVVSFGSPFGITIDDHGNIYTSYAEGYLQKISPSGTITTLSQREHTPASNIGENVYPYQPHGLTIDSEGDLYVTDSMRSALFKAFPSYYTNDNVIVTHHPEDTTGMMGDALTLKTAALGTPPLQYQWQKDGTNIFGATNAIYAVTNAQPVDAGLYSVTIAGPTKTAVSYEARLKVTVPYTFSTVAGYPWMRGNSDGNGIEARFGEIGGICLDTNNNLLATDARNRAIRQISPQGTVSSIMGLILPFEHDPDTFSQYMITPLGVTKNKNGDLFFADQGAQTIWRYESNGALTRLKTRPAYCFDAATQTSFEYPVFNPQGIAVSSSGNIYVTAGNAVWQLDASGAVTNLVGYSLNGFSEGKGSVARFQQPTGIAVDDQGILYVADTGNHVIRRITPDGVVITFAGAPTESGYADGEGLAARFDSPTGIAMDTQNNLFVADTGNQVIRKITPQGEVSTIAGSKITDSTAFESRFADGTGRQSRFESPQTITVGENGDIYVVDNLTTIRKGWLTTPEKDVSLTSLSTRAVHAPYGGSITLGFTVESILSSTTQWCLANTGEAIPGQTNSTLELDSMTTIEPGGYRLVFQNALGSFYGPDVFIVLHIPLLLSPPEQMSDGRVMVQARSSGGHITWPNNYSLQWRSTLAADSLEEWKDVPDQGRPIYAGSGVIFTDDTAVGQPKRFYRVVEYLPSNAP